MEQTNANLEQLHGLLLAIADRKAHELSEKEKGTLSAVGVYHADHVIEEDGNFYLVGGEKKWLFFYERTFHPAYSEEFTARVFSQNIIQSAIEEYTTPREIWEWAYEASIQGMQDGVVMFDVVDWEFSTHGFSTGEFCDCPEKIELARVSQNLDANSDFDLITCAVGQDFGAMAGWARKQYPELAEEYEDDAKLLREVYDAHPDEFDDKLAEISGQGVDDWRLDYYFVDAEIDWEKIWQDF